MSKTLHSEFKEIAAGAGFTEGPIAVDGGVIFTSINRGMLYRVGWGAPSMKEYAETGGGPNGLALGADGVVFVAQNGGEVIPTKSTIRCKPSIQSVSRAGETRSVSEQSYFAPNDCAFGPDGRLWFTDPFGSTKGHEPRPGRVWALDVANGKSEIILDGLSHPNGLAFGLDSDELYVAETLRKRIIRVRRSGLGWSHAGVFAELPVGEPDGMAFDVAGRLWVAASEGDALVVFEPNGSVAKLVELGSSFPTNLCFAGPDLTTLVVTTPKGGRVIAAEVGDRGARLLTPEK